jgi:hypothetical protein
MILLAAVPTFAVGSWLMIDIGSVYCVRHDDPARGVVRGCYTELELILGVDRPASIRSEEGIAALAAMCATGALLLLGACWWFVATLRARPSSRSTQDGTTFATSRSVR